MKKVLIVIIVIICSYYNVIAQAASKPKKEKITFPPNSKIVSIGIGKNSPSSNTKAKSNGLGDIQLIGELYLPLKSLSNTIDFGFNTNLQYTIGTGSLTTDGYSTYNIQGQPSTPTIAARGSGSPRQAGFRVVAAPQVNIRNKKLCISPSFGVGFMTQTQKEMSIVQTSKNGSLANEYNLLWQGETKTDGLLLLPKLRLSYSLGKMAIWAEGQYLIGPEIKNTATRFVPQGSPNSSGSYTLSQMELGSNVAYLRESINYRSLGLNAGVSFLMGKPKKPNRGKHTCLICGRKHRGICRFGITENQDLANLQRLIQSDCKGLYDGNSENCDAKKGICCTDDVAVSSGYDLNKLYTIIETKDATKIKNHIMESNFEGAIGKQASSEIWKSILNGLKNNTITFELANAKNNKKSLLLKSILSSQNSNQQQYYGHVTLLR